MIIRYINLHLHLHYICCVQNKMLLPYLFLWFWGKPSALPTFDRIVLKLVSRPPQSILLHRRPLTAPKSVVGVSHGVFHSRLKTHPFSRSFPP